MLVLDKCDFQAAWLMHSLFNLRGLFLNEFRFSLSRYPCAFPLLCLLAIFSRAID
jgi:hypothetical protein